MIGVYNIPYKLINNFVVCPHILIAVLPVDYRNIFSIEGGRFGQFLLLLRLAKFRKLYGVVHPKRWRIYNTREAPVDDHRLVC